MNFVCFLVSADRSQAFLSTVTQEETGHLAPSAVGGCSRGAESVRSLLSGAFCNQVLGLYLSALYCVVAGTLYCLTFSFSWEVIIGMRTVTLPSMLAGATR